MKEVNITSGLSDEYVPFTSSFQSFIRNRCSDDGFAHCLGVQCLEPRVPLYASAQYSTRDPVRAANGPDMTCMGLPAFDCGTLSCDGSSWLVCPGAHVVSTYSSASGP